MKVVKVVCGIIWKDNLVLIAKRKEEKSLGGFWEFPGGKIEDSEDPLDTLTRELKEELGMKVSVGDHFKTVIHEYEQFTIELISFYCKFLEADFKMTDHDAYEWVNTSDLMKWKLAPADIPIAIELNRLIGN